MAISVVVPFNLVDCVLGRESDEHTRSSHPISWRGCLGHKCQLSDMVSFKLKDF